MSDVVIRLAVGSDGSQIGLVHRARGRRHTAVCCLSPSSTGSMPLREASTGSST